MFVNSEYWGVYNIREKINEFYIDNHYNLGDEGIDILQGYNFVEEGSGEKYDDMLQYIDENSLSELEHYNQIKKMMNVENFRIIGYIKFISNKDAEEILDFGDLIR